MLGRNYHWKNIMNYLPPFSLHRSEVTVHDSEVIWRHPRDLFRVHALSYQHPVFKSEETYTVKRVLVEKRASVIALPYDPLRDAVVLIEQVRPVKVFTDADSPCMFELCAGLVDPGESAEQALRRELDEECALSAGRIEPISQYWVSPGWTSEQLSIYCVEVNTSTIQDVCGNVQECESIHVSVMPFSQLMQALDARNIDNGGLLIGALWLSRHRDRLRKEWAKNT